MFFNLILNKNNVLHQILDYDDNKDYHTLSHNYIISKLSKFVKRRVIFSMLEPDYRLENLYRLLISNTDYIDGISNLVNKLNRKIYSISIKNNYKKINLVAVLRSGLLVTALVKDYLESKGLDVNVTALSPNYLNCFDKDRINKFMMFCTDNCIFIDGWISTGITYNIIKNFYNKSFPNSSFLLAVLSNLANIKNNNIIFSTNNDVLFPWSIMQTKNSGMSNFFLDPSTNIPSCFNVHDIDSGQKLYLELKKRLNNNIFFEDNFRKNNKKILVGNGKIFKYGINEVIKSLEKGDKIKIFIGNDVRGIKREILMKYMEIYNMKYNIINGNDCYIERYDGQ